MVRTVEAEINVDGTVTLLKPLRVTMKTRALVTVVGEEAKTLLDFQGWNAD